MIHTPRLQIAPAEPDDAMFISSLWNNPVIMEHVGFPAGLNSSIESIRQQIKATPQGMFEHLLSIRLRKTKQRIGQAIMHSPDKNNCVVTDIKLDPEFHGQHYGTETKEALISHAFQYTDCLAVEASPNLKNIASIRMQEAVGAIRIGRGRHIFPAGMSIPTHSVDYWLYRRYRDSSSIVDIRQMSFEYVAIVPAAGRSRRMKHFKQLLPWPPNSSSPMTVIESTVNNLMLAGCHKIVVVTGHRGQEVQHKLQDWPVQCCINDTPDAPMSSSIVVAVQTLTPAKMKSLNEKTVPTAFVLLPGDHPEVSPESIRQLIHHHEKHPGTIHLPSYQNRSGHPAVFPPESRKHLLNPDPNHGLRALIQHGPFEVLRHAMPDPGIMKNLDYPEDYSSNPIQPE